VRAEAEAEKAGEYIYGKTGIFSSRVQGSNPVCRRGVIRKNDENGRCRGKSQVIYIKLKRMKKAGGGGRSISRKI